MCLYKVIWCLLISEPNTHGFLVNRHGGGCLTRIMGLHKIRFILNSLKLTQKASFWLHLQKNPLLSTWLLCFTWEQSHIIPLLSVASEGYFALLTTNLETSFFFLSGIKAWYFWKGLGVSVTGIAERHIINAYFSSEGFKKRDQKSNNDHTQKWIK